MIPHSKSNKLSPIYALKKFDLIFHFEDSPPNFPCSFHSHQQTPSTKVSVPSKMWTPLLQKVTARRINSISWDIFSFFLGIDFVLALFCLHLIPLLLSPPRRPIILNPIQNSMPISKLMLCLLERRKDQKPKKTEQIDRKRIDARNDPGWKKNWFRNSKMRYCAHQIKPKVAPPMVDKI